MDQTEKLKLVDVEVTDRLHCRQLGHHLQGQKMLKGKVMYVNLYASVFV